MNPSFKERQQNYTTHEQSWNELSVDRGAKIFCSYFDAQDNTETTAPIETNRQYALHCCVPSAPAAWMFSSPRSWPTAWRRYPVRPRPPPPPLGRPPGPRSMTSRGAPVRRQQKKARQHQRCSVHSMKKLEIVGVSSVMQHAQFTFSYRWLHAKVHMWPFVLPGIPQQ